MLERILHEGAVVGSVVASTLSGWRGGLSVRPATQPAKALILYDMEGCPFCRLVREALSALHLDVEIRPCPKGGKRFRPEVERRGGKQQFPYFVDENTGLAMYESADIVDHLFRTYGRGTTPKAYQRSPLRPVLGSLTSGVRLGRGVRARRAKAPPAPLAVWSFEASPYSRLVRECLTELELSYTLHNLAKEHWREAGPAMRRITPNPYVPKAGGKRHAFWAAHGRVQLPYLEDPNTGAALFESADIIAYLERTYALTPR
jgi:glutathione S-transferase